MKISKLIFTILLFFCSANLVLADTFRLSAKEGKYEDLLPNQIGLSQIAIIHFWSTRYPVDTLTTTFTAEDLLKHAKRFPFLKEIFDKYNMAYNLENLKPFEKLAYRVISRAWTDARNSLYNCQDFRNAQGGKAFNEWLENTNNKKIPFSFNNFQSYGEAKAWTEQGRGRNAKKSIHFPYKHFIDIANYCAEKMAGGNSDIEISDYRNSLNELYSYLGHEMMHAFTDILDYQNRFNTKEEDAREEAVECEVHCLQKQCLDPSTVFPSKYDCDKRCGSEYCAKGFKECNQEPPGDGSGGGGGGKTKKRGSETPDDNYSFFTGAAFSSTTDFSIETIDDFLSFSFYPDVLVYEKFGYIDMPQLLDKYSLDHINDYSHDYFDNNHKILVIPSGEWMGDEHSEVIGEAIKQFVESGGTLLVLTQQYDEHIHNLVPVPQGETLTSYGWRQDQSCYSGSVYFNGMHPDTDWGASHLT